MTNSNFGKLNGSAIEYAPSVLRIGDAVICTPTAADYAACGWKRVNMSTPSEPAPIGYHYEPDGYEETESEIRRRWKTVEDAPIYRKFSKLKIYGAIISLPDANGVTAWGRVKAWLEAKTINGVNGWMAFQLAQDISEEHPLFSALAEEARVLLGLTNEQFDALLNSCILEG